MAQRRSRNRRLSSRRSSNISGFLDDNTNVVDNNDPLWFNRTALRPSTSFVVTKNASSILNDDSTIHVSQLSEKWFENLSRSDSSMLMEEAVRKNVNDRLNDEETDARNIDPSTESESEHESQKRRANFRLNQKKVNKSDKSNAFLKALEKTTDSYTRNLTNVQVSEGNESETTNESTRTIKLKQRVFRLNKREKTNASNFDDVFQSDSASEKIRMNPESSRASLKRKSQNVSTDEKVQKQKKPNSEENITEKDAFNEQSHEKTIVEARGSLRINDSKTVAESVATTNSSIQLRCSQELRLVINELINNKKDKQNKDQTVDKTMIANVSETEKIRKKRLMLFSQENKNQFDQNLFDGAFESEDSELPNSEKKLLIDTSKENTERNANKQNNENNQEHGNESESSSIPKNIRRTRSRSNFAQLNSGSESEDNVHSNNSIVDTNKTKINESKKSQRKSMRNSLKKSNKSKRLSELQNNTKNTHEDGNESENSTIPTNIRKTRSQSVAAQRRSDNKSVNKDIDHSPNKSRRLSTESHENVISQRKSTRHSLQESKNQSQKQSKSKNKSSEASVNNESASNTVDVTNKNAFESSDEDSIHNAPTVKNASGSHENVISPRKSTRLGLQKSKNQSKSKNKSMNISKTNEDLINESSDENNIHNAPTVKNTPESDKVTKSHNRLLKRKSTLMLNESKSSTNRTSKSSSRVNNDEEIAKENTDSSSSEIGSKSRSRVFKRKIPSKRRSIFDDTNELDGANEKSTINHEKETSKTLQGSKLNESLNNSKDLSRSTTSKRNQYVNISLINKSPVPEITHNDDSHDENETSTIPKYIRRTKSRLFKKSHVSGDGNVFSEILNSENSPVKESSKSNKHNVSLGSKHSIDELLTSASQLQHISTRKDKSKKRPLSAALQRLSERLNFDKSSDDSLKENRKTSQNKKSQKSKSESVINKSNVSMNQSRTFSVHVNATNTKRKSSEIMAEESDKASYSLDESSDNAEKSKNETVANKTNLSMNPSRISNTSKNAISASRRSSENIAEQSDKASYSLEEESSVETTTDGTPSVDEKRLPSTNEQSSKKSKSLETTDDLVHTPNRAQSTLISKGKPLTRITEFSLKIPTISDTESPQSPPTNSATVNHERKESKHVQANEDEDEYVDVTDSDVSETPLLTRRPTDIPDDTVSSVHKEIAPHPNVSINVPSSFCSNNRLNKSNRSVVDKNVTRFDESVWTKMREKTDVIKKAVAESEKREEKLRIERERQKALTDAKVRRLMAQQEAETKRKKKPPIDKAYYVNGHLYKQPKLPRPKQWVTDRLYKHLWKCMEPKYGLKMRIKSEYFVKKLSDFFTVITRRKKYENYVHELDDLMITMAELNIVKTRYEFYRFCSNYMPANFRSKVVPMQLPGNVSNIPYDKELLHKPILDGRAARDSDSESVSND